MKDGAILTRVLQRLESVLPEELTTEMRQNIESSIEAVIAEMDLVTREEFDIQRNMLAKALERVDALEAKLKQ